MSKFDHMRLRPDGTVVPDGPEDTQEPESTDDAGEVHIYGFERVVGNLVTGEVNVQLVFPDQEHMRRVLDLCRQKAEAAQS